MNTVELYVEPILIGALTLALLILPFAPELLDFARSETLKPFGDVALGAVLVGVAYFVGILADRLIDTCLQPLERHNRVRFALSSLKVPVGLKADTPEGRKAAWDTRPSGDPFPEDRYRWRVFTQAERIADSLDYIRTRIRLLRALTFLLPGLVFAGTLGAARLEFALLCSFLTRAGSSPRPIRCNGVDWMVPSPATEVWLLFFAPCLYAATIVAAAALGAWDSRLWRSRKTHWRRAGLWRPPHTASDCRMKTYAEARDWPVGDRSQLNLWSDILAQPVVWCLVSLLLASIPTILWLNSNSVPGSVVGALAGPLFTVAAGWAWWRITGTFMGYLKSSGQFLEKQAEMSAPDRRKS